MLDCQQGRPELLDLGFQTGNPIVHDPSLSRADYSTSWQVLQS